MDPAPDQAETSAVAPPVVAVVVTCDPGPWLETALGALGDQDYPNLSVLVVDAGSTQDPTSRVAGVLPQAYVRRLPERVGFAPAANQVLELVEGASHYLICHDDVAPDPDAVRVLVEEAFRSNAGVVTPKVVAWDAPERILQVGMAADKSGAPSPLAERGELDQEQHDAVRDVFFAPGGCTLVRADLFALLGGFDPAMTLYGEDLDLSWRAQVAGARVIVAPGARVRHLEALTAGRRDGGRGQAGQRGVEDGRVDAAELRDRLRPLQLRHRLRSVLKNYGPFHLIRVVPQLLVLVLAELAYALVTGRRRTAAAIAGAWTWNLRRAGELRRLRRELRRIRAMPDSEVRRLQVRGSARFTAFLRGQLAGEDRARVLTAAGRDLAVSLRDLRVPLVAWGGIALVLLVGSRHLLGRPLPVLGELVPFPDSPATFLRLFVSGWRTSGLGSEGSAPAAFGLLGVAGVVLLGAMGVLQKLLVLGALPAGVLGAYRLALPLVSVRARLVAAVAYAAVPLPYNALARGRWGGLLAYALAPWVLARLLRAADLTPRGDGEDELPGAAPAQEAPPVPPVQSVAEPPPPPTSPPVIGRRLPPLIPHGDPLASLSGPDVATGDEPEQEWPLIPHGDPLASLSGPDLAPPEEAVGAPEPLGARPGAPAPRSGRSRQPRWRLADHALPLGLLLAAACALAPVLVPMTLLTATAVLVAAAVTGRLGSGVRALATAVGGVAVAAVVLFPWTLEFVLPGANWATFGVDLTATRGLGLGALLRFETGPLGAAPLGWAFVVAAALPLLIARGRRLELATAAWVVLLVCTGAAWAGGREWLPFPLPSPEVVLAPAAAAVALAAGLGLLAFEVDLRGFGFGWRQMVSAVAGASVVGVVPVLGAAVDGRWDLPRRDTASLVAFLPSAAADGAYRVLWLGDPEVLPLQGWRLADGVAYGTSRNGVPDATELWPGSADGATQLIPDAVNLARRGDTSRLGHLLAPMAVRYVVVPFAGTGRAAGPAVVAALDGQVDLRQLQRDEQLVVFENAAWAPARARLTPAAAEASQASGLEAARVTEMAGSAPVLPRERSQFRFTGTVPEGAIYLAEAHAPGWQLSVEGGSAEHRKAFGWANAYDVEGGGPATLRYRTSLFRFLAIGMELVLLFVVVRATLAARRRGRTP